MRDFDSKELREQIREFLVRQVGLDFSDIERIQIEQMRDGQLRNIHIDFIPSIYKENKNA